MVYLKLGFITRLFLECWQISLTKQVLSKVLKPYFFFFVLRYKLKCIFLPGLVRDVFLGSRLEALPKQQYLVKHQLFSPFSFAKFLSFSSIIWSTISDYCATVQKPIWSGFLDLFNYFFASILFKVLAQEKINSFRVEIILILGQVSFSSDKEIWGN